MSSVEKGSSCSDKTKFSQSGFPVNNLFLDKDFEKYAERTRASWSVFRYLGVVLQQYLRRGGIEKK